MVSDGPGLQYPRRPSGLRSLHLSTEDSSSELDEASPCRPRTHNMYAGPALRDGSARANIRANLKRTDLSIGDVVASLTNTCHISSNGHESENHHPAKLSGKPAMGLDAPLPYPRNMFRKIRPLSRPATPDSAQGSLGSEAPSPLHVALDSPLASPLGSPLSSHLSDFSLRDVPAADYFGTTPLASPSICTELESEVGTDVETDADSETEPETEEEHDGAQQRRRFQLSPQQTAQQRLTQQARWRLPQEAHQENIRSGHFAPALALGSAQETSTPMIRSQNLYRHSVNKSAIGISFSSSHDDSLTEEDEGEGFQFDNNASPAPAPRGLRASFDRMNVWIPPAKVRRTQSMFATPEQLMHEQLGHIEGPMHRIGEDSLVGVIGSPECPLATYPVKQDPFKRINHTTLCQLLDGQYKSTFSEVIVIDCRFEYEYEGGHISGAVNVNTKQQLEQYLFHERACAFDQSVLLVFHCEYSAYRSPLLASHLRQLDRHHNAPHYPKLFYPDVLVLDGGYSQFYASSAQRCVPQSYVGMDHKEHRKTCEREMSRFRSGMRARKLPTFNAGNSVPNLTDFRFPKPAPALRSASVIDLNQPGPSANDLDIL